MAIKIVQNNLYKNKTQEEYMRILSSFDRINVDGIYYITDIYDVLDKEYRVNEEKDERYVYELPPMQLYDGFDLKDTRQFLGQQTSEKMNGLSKTPFYSKYRLLNPSYQEYTNQKQTVSFFAYNYASDYYNIFHKYRYNTFYNYMKNGSISIDDENIELFKIEASNILGLPTQLTSSNGYSSSYRLSDNTEIQGLLDFPLREGENPVTTLGHLARTLMGYEDGVLETLPKNNNKYKIMNEYMEKVNKAQECKISKSFASRELLPHYRNLGTSIPLHFHRNSYLYNFYKSGIEGDDFIYKNIPLLDSDRFPTYNVFPSKNYFPNLFSNDPIFDSKNQGRYLKNDYYYLSNPNNDFDTKTDYMNDLYYIAKNSRGVTFDISKRYKTSTEAHDDLFGRLGILIIQSTENIIMQKFINREYIFYRYGYKYGQIIRWTTWKNNIPNNTKNSDELNNADSLHYPIGFGAYRNNGHFTSIKGKTFNRKDIEELINSYGAPLTDSYKLEEKIEEYFKTRAKLDYHNNLFIKIEGDTGIDNLNLGDTSFSRVLLRNKNSSEDCDSAIVINADGEGVFGIDTWFAPDRTNQALRYNYNMYGVNTEKINNEKVKNMEDKIFYQIGAHHLNVKTHSGYYSAGFILSEYKLATLTKDVPDRNTKCIRFFNGYKDSKLKSLIYPDMEYEFFLPGTKSYKYHTYRYSEPNLSAKKIYNYLDPNRFVVGGATSAEIPPEIDFIEMTLYLSYVKVTGPSTVQYIPLKKNFTIRRFEDFIFKGKYKITAYNECVLTNFDDPEGEILVVGYDSKASRLFCYGLDSKGNRQMDKFTFTRFIPKFSEDTNNINNKEPQTTGIDLNIDNHLHIIKT